MIIKLLVSRVSSTAHTALSYAYSVVVRYELCHYLNLLDLKKKTLAPAEILSQVILCSYDVKVGLTRSLDST